MIRTAQEQVGVVIVGCGYWGMNYVRVFHELPGAKVVAACDTRQERLNEVAQRFPEIGLTTSISDAIRMPKVNAVIICTGATTHYHVVRQALMAGKHVLVEKPMATKVKEAKALMNIAEQKGLSLMVGHTFLYNAGVRMVKEQIQHSDMGSIYYLYSCRTNLGPIRNDVNAIWDLAPHDISIFNYFLDASPSWVSAVGLNVLHDTREDVGFITLGYGSDILGNIHVSWVDPNKVRQLVVVGSQKRIVFDDLNTLEQVKIFEKGVALPEREASTFGEHQFEVRDGDIFSPKVEASEPLKQQCLHFLDCVTLGIQPQTDGHSGLAVVQVLAAVEQSIAQNGAPIAIEPAVAVTAHHRNGTTRKPQLEKVTG